MALVTHRIFSPAKINLMLRVLSRRADGYHNLQTCFQILDWGDWMTFEPIKAQGSHQIEITGFQGVATKDNLIYQAAEMLLPWAQVSSDWRIKVEKNIPMGSGLGGGSSNAAVALKFFNEHWQCDLSTFDLLAMAAQLGADVPVFICGQGALGTGIGESLQPMSFHTPHVLLMFPEVAINTAELFGSPTLKRDQVELKPSLLHDADFWINDFFPEVLSLYPAINSLYQQLKLHMPVRLSGSGSTLFAVFEDGAAAEQARADAEPLVACELVQPMSE